MDAALRQHLMDQARAEAELGWAEGGIPIGAVLATEAGEVVARGHNQRVQNGDPTSHGETQCIRNAGRRRDWDQLTLVTPFPCPMCAGICAIGVPPRVDWRAQQLCRSGVLAHDAGIEVDCLDDAGCKALMERMLQQSLISGLKTSAIKA